MRARVCVLVCVFGYIYFRFSSANLKTPRPLDSGAQPDRLSIVHCVHQGNIFHFRSSSLWPPDFLSYLQLLASRLRPSHQATKTAQPPTTPPLQLVKTPLFGYVCVSVCECVCGLDALMSLRMCVQLRIRRPRLNSIHFLPNSGKPASLSPSSCDVLSPNPTHLPESPIHP